MFLCILNIGEYLVLKFLIFFVLCIVILNFGFSLGDVFFSFFGWWYDVIMYG